MRTPRFVAAAVALLTASQSFGATCTAKLAGNELTIVCSSSASVPETCSFTIPVKGDGVAAELNGEFSVVKTDRSATKFQENRVEGKPVTSIGKLNYSCRPAVVAAPDIKNPKATDQLILPAKPGGTTTGVK